MNLEGSSFSDISWPLGTFSHSSLFDASSNENSPVFNMFDNEESKKHGIYTFEFGKEDIVRSEILAYIIEQFENAKK